MDVEAQNRRNTITMVNIKQFAPVDNIKNDVELLLVIHSFQGEFAELRGGMAKSQRKRGHIIQRRL